jgi:ABC-type branched-subunit amino acid transport system ATPase component
MAGAAAVASPNRTANSPVLESSGLSVGYGSLVVARNLKLAVDRGQVLLLMGPNGAGKSTTLRSLAGVLPTIAGTVSWRGEPMTGPLHRRISRGLGYVPDERGVISALTVSANLRLSHGSVTKALELFPELADHLGRKAGLLSGGQQKMLSLAIALCRDPVLLLADELSLGLAPQIVTRLLGAVRAAADRGAAVILVEQHAREALGIADTVAVLSHGRIDLSGPVGQVRAAAEELLAQGYLAPRQTRAEEAAGTRADGATASAVSHPRMTGDEK